MQIHPPPIPATLYRFCTSLVRYYRVTSSALSDEVWQKFIDIAHVSWH